MFLFICWDLTQKIRHYWIELVSSVRWIICWTRPNTLVRYQMAGRKHVVDTGPTKAHSHFIILNCAQIRVLPKWINQLQQSLLTAISECRIFNIHCEKADQYIDIHLVHKYYWYARLHLFDRMHHNWINASSCSCESVRAHKVYREHSLLYNYAVRVYELSYLVRISLFRPGNIRTKLKYVNEWNYYLTSHSKRLLFQLRAIAFVFIGMCAQFLHTYVWIIVIYSDYIYSGVAEKTVAITHNQRCNNIVYLIHTGSEPIRFQCPHTHIYHFRSIRSAHKLLFVVASHFILLFLF